MKSPVVYSAFRKVETDIGCYDGRFNKNLICTIIFGPLGVGWDTQYVHVQFVFREDKLRSKGVNPGSTKTEGG